MKILLFWISLFALSSELNDLLKLNVYGQKQFSGETCLYLPLNDYDKDVVTLSLSFDNGLYYSNIYIYYR